MAERNKRMSALILSMQDSGENNRLAKIFSPDEGIFRAVLYGGAKSRLRSLIQPFYSGTIYVYRDSVRKFVKITDFDPKKFRLSLRTNLYKTMAANFAAEIVVKTKCAGDGKNSFILLNSFLDGIDAVSEPESKLGLLRFLWRYQGLLGQQMETRFCASCGTSLLDHEKNAVYDESLNGFVCGDCNSFSEKKFSAEFFRMDLDSLTYLSAINELSPGMVRKLFVPAESVLNMKKFLFHLIEKSAGTGFATLECSNGIL